MKVALCLSGQIRSHELVKNSIKKHVIDLYDCDVFCHFWHKYDDEKFKNFYNANCGYDYGKYDSKKIDDVINFYKPVSLKYTFPFIEQNTKSMLYSVQEANNLKLEYEKNNNMEYDVVIRCRYDILFKENFELDYPKNNTAYLMQRSVGYNDWVIYGNSKTMDIYSNAYQHYQNTERILQSCPEKLYQDYLNNKDLSVNYIKRTFSIIREDGFEII